LSLRPVEIPVKKDVRDALRSLKGDLTWDEFFLEKILGDKNG